MTCPTYAIIILAVCILAAFIFVIFIRKSQKYKVAGTMYVDTSRSNKDVCRFVLEMPLSDIEHEKAVLVRIDGFTNLREWED